MKIALLGYGKMGKTIERIAISRGHEIVLRADETNASTITDADLKNADVAIEFSTPKSAVDNILRCFRCAVPVVAGTTGWLEQMEQVKEEMQKMQGGFFYASNFSVGVNIFFRLNQHLAKLMKGQSEYAVSMEEIHHVHKLDAPSGTAITLAEGLMNELGSVKNWKSYTENETVSVDASALPIVSKRIGEVPGTHTITYTSATDRIDITHTAHSREGFALGAVLAAEFMQGKKGAYGMNDLLGF